jgi:predicted house-cleaning noncanonical NTP pyrophosphatase (MazG superfamily)
LGSAEEGSSGPTLLEKGYYWWNKSCGTKRGNIDDIICQSKKVKAYSKIAGEEHRLRKHEKNLAESIKKYIEEKYKPIAIPSYEIEQIIPQIQAIDNLDKTNINTIISTIPKVVEKLAEINVQGHY